VDEGVGAGEDPRQRRHAGDEGQHAHPLARGRRRRPGADREQHVRRAEPRHRVGEHVEMLLGREAAGVDEHPGVGGEAEPGAPSGVGTIRMERGGVDAERLQRDPLDAPLAEMATQARARREHEVEAAIEVLRVAARRARGDAAEGAARGEARHRLEVGVAGRDRGDAARARRVERAQATRIRDRPASIRSGRSAGEHARDGDAAQRQAVATAARQRQRRQLAWPAAEFAPGTAIVCRQPGWRAQPVVLGEQVAAHAAAGRAPEHRRVDDVDRLRHGADCADRRLLLLPSIGGVGLGAARRVDAARGDVATGLAHHLARRAGAAVGRFVALVRQARRRLAVGRGPGRRARLSVVFASSSLSSSLSSWRSFVAGSRRQALCLGHGACRPLAAGVPTGSAVATPRRYPRPLDFTEALEDSDADVDAAATSGLDFFVVGVGASAGGLKAVKTLLEGMPAKPDMAFVIVLHLSPKHESNAAAIFQPSTRMPVLQVTERTKIERNHVYVIPPGRELVMVDGALDVASTERTAGRHTVIDVFFRTLAHQHKTRAVGIVLSGTGSDGAVGIASLKEKGGLAIAQAPEDAEHDGMPASAIATGKVDIVLPVADIPERLMQLWQNASRIEIPDRAKVDQNAKEAPPSMLAEEALRDVMTVLQQRTGHSFKNYKRGTVLRRIERRMQVNRLPTLDAYRSFVTNDAEEPRALLSDMLIGVTQFFRDRGAFEALEREVLPGIFKQAMDEGSQVRGWVAGCSSGEEAYSIAILMAEEAARQRSARGYTLFATDIDAEALARARAGVYPAAIVTDVPPTRLRAAFTAEHGGFRVHKGCATTSSSPSTTSCTTRRSRACTW
jgi:hypothetical protein